MARTTAALSGSMEGREVISEEMGGDDPEGVPPEQVVGALYQGY